MSSTSTERALITQLLSGSERAFDEFFALYFPRLFRFALARVGEDEDIAEEVVQATLCAATSKLHTFKGEAQLFTWLCTFCRHEISAYFRREQREQPEVALPEGLDLEAVLDSLVASQTRPEEEFRRREIGRLVRVALDHLPPNYGNVLEWKYLDGQSVDEIAKNLKVSAKAAESQLTRARIAFKEAFSVLCGGRSAAEMEGRLEA